MNTQELIDSRRTFIHALCEERGGWGDGTNVTLENIEDAARNPLDYGIDPEDLDEAIKGDVRAIISLRAVWGLPIFV